MKAIQLEIDGVLISANDFKKKNPNLYDEFLTALNELYPQSKVKILPVAGVVGRSEQFICGKQDVSSTHQKCNSQCDGCKPRGNHSK